MKDASITQDISKPLRSDLIGQFDLAIDGGTLEHVFNFPAAVANLMRLVKVGGAVYTQNPCNSLAGHGFYQFSPELMYRVFSKQNGFDIYSCGWRLRVINRSNRRPASLFTKLPIRSNMGDVYCWRGQIRRS